jgi:hypothetical protein
MSPYEILFGFGAARRQSDRALVRALSALYPLDRGSEQVREAVDRCDVGC